MLASLLQASWELLKMFDRVIILTNDGRIAYWGALQDALPYFESLGYPCPRSFSPAEFLALVVDHPDKFLRIYQEEAGPESGLPPAPVVTTPSGFADAWSVSEARMRMLAQAGMADVAQPLSIPNGMADDVAQPLSVPNGVEAQLHQKEAKGEPVKQRGRRLKTKVHLDRTPAEQKYARSSFEQFRLLLWRSSRIYLRERRRYTLTALGLLITAMVMGLLFLNRGDSLQDAQIKFGLLFFVVARISLNSLATIAIAFMDRPVFYRQRNAHYYRVFPYVLSSLIATIPEILAEVRLSLSLSLLPPSSFFSSTRARLPSKRSSRSPPSCTG